MWLASYCAFRFFRTRSLSCCTRICAFALIPLMEYDVVFLSMFVNSLMLGFIGDGSWFANHSVSFFRDWSFRSRICSSVSSEPSACVKKNYSPSATSEEDGFTSMGVFCRLSRILRRIFSVTSSSILERKSAAVLTEPAIYAFLKLNCKP